MTRLIWGLTREYQIGLERGVLYPNDGPGEAWNGLVSIEENPDGDVLIRYIDGQKLELRRDQGSFNGRINAYTFPDSFYENVLRQARPRSFGLSYRVGPPENQKIHLVYNVLVVPSAYSYEQVEPDLFRWSFTSLPVPVPEAERSAHLVVDTATAYSSTLSDLESILYGSESASARLPSPAEVVDIFEQNAILRVTNHGDGTFTIDGPDSAVTMVDSTTFQVDWPSVIVHDADNYQISSL